jgi:Flp pilus assembly protein TadG
MSAPAFPLRLLGRLTPVFRLGAIAHPDKPGGIMLLRSRLNRRPGNACVELAVALPVLVTLLLGIWEVGRMVETTQVVSNAAREGVRAAANGNKTPTQIDTIVRNYLQAAGFNTTGYTVKVYNLTQNPTPAANAPSDDPNSAARLDELQVRVTLPFNNVKWIFLNQLTSVTTLNAEANWYVMRDEPLVVDSTMPN